MAGNNTEIDSKILLWYDQHQRALPWRKNKSLYRIWISEIMLQQTQVATVINFFQRFVRKFPTIRQLASADEADVLKLWEGLGYYRRARQLHAAAKTIVEKHQGRFPTDFDDVLALPGIGRYTAGAILSIGLDQPHPILEANTIRLFARLLGLKTDPRSSENQQQLWAFSRRLLPSKRVGDFNQALMELGSTICTPKKPACSRCPLKNICPTFTHGWQTRIPVATARTKYENITEAILLIKRRGKYLVRLCPAGGRWGGLWDFPRYQIDGVKGAESLDWLQDQVQQEFGLATMLQTTRWHLQHSITRFRIRLDCYRSIVTRGRLRSRQPCRWVSVDEIDELGMNASGRKIAQLLS